MLTTLSVRDVVLIERLDIPFGPGLTALTGETGAGKSILLDSLGLALGERAAPGLIREGAEGCSVTASFAVPRCHPVTALLAESGIEAPSDEALVLRRAVSRDGRSRAFVNDQPVGVGLLRNAGALLVEIQGQHEQMGLADPATHLALLDAFGVPDEPRREVAARFATWLEARRRVEEAERAIVDATREEDWLRASVEELTSLGPVAGEEDALAGRRVALQRNERRAEAIAAALAELAPRDRRDRGPAAALRAASRALGRAGGDDPDPIAAEAAAELDRAEDALANAEGLLGRLVNEADRDPRALEAAEERLFALRAAARKHGIAPAELVDHLAGLRSRLDLLESGVRDVDALRGARDRARVAFAEAASRLASAREAAARRLEVAVAAELAPLRLGRARFVVEQLTLAEDRWTERGKDGAAFLIAANPGQAPSPLGRVASGGELSRLMLALKVVLAAGAPAGTLVFDEVDSGIGGATANAVGERLARVAAGSQVLVVTHAPQVAARADHHLTVSKHIRGERTTTEVTALDVTARREEIARMLAGEEVTDAARLAAASLLGVGEGRAKAPRIPTRKLRTGGHFFGVDAAGAGGISATDGSGGTGGEE